jgi:hypothetical protein
MGARAEQADAGGQHRAPQLSERRGRLGRRTAHRADELDLAGMQLTLDLARRLADALGDRSRGVDLGAAQPVDEEQLLLDPDGERALVAERRGREIVD